jgi:tungstate transport system ATP-binding protein
VSGAAPIIELRGLHVRREGRPVLSIPEIAVREGEVLALIGPNGAGKTTLLHAIMRLVGFGQGEILFRGRPAGAGGALHVYRRNFSLVFQEPLLFNTTVRANVASGLKIRGVKKDVAESVVREQLRRFGISHLHDRHARGLSGGEAQRVNLARAFAVNPQVLLLDEPFAALDLPTREALMDDLERVIRDTFTTTIFATHDRSEAIRLSDRIAVMNEGAILQIDSPEAVMQRPADEFVASFVGTETVLSGTVTGAGEGTFTVLVAGKEIEIAGRAVKGERVTFGIRPENVIIDMEHERRSSARNSFRGRITRIVPAGAWYKVHVDCGFPVIAYVTPHSVKDLGLSEHMEASAAFKATSIHVIRKGR